MVLEVHQGAARVGDGGGVANRQPTVVRDPLLGEAELLWRRRGRSRRRRRIEYPAATDRPGRCSKRLRRRHRYPQWRPGVRACGDIPVLPEVIRRSGHGFNSTEGPRDPRLPGGGRGRTRAFAGQERRGLAILLHPLNRWSEQTVGHRGDDLPTQTYISGPLRGVTTSVVAQRAVGPEGVEADLGHGPAADAASRRPAVVVRRGARRREAAARSWVPLYKVVCPSAAVAGIPTGCCSPVDGAG
mmetsp:Transcript_95976/g.311297  ORF Transcript_95976/g.311297 Transcript_95976/m.311297 type:complete len:243 (-) Transcript_95976:409-1137(-)